MGAGVAIGGLVASALLFAPAAQAADTITNVRESEIAANETTYAGWHQGAEGGKYQVVNDGLELTGKSQVIKGYTENSNTDLGNKDKRNADFADLAAARFTTKAGTPTFQAPLFADLDGDGPQEPVFTTLYTDDVAGGNWFSSQAIGDIPANTEKPLGDFETAIGESYRIIAFGVANETDKGTVKDITFDGTQYTFGNNAPVAHNRSYKTKIETPVTVNLGATDVDGNALTYNASVNTGSLSGTGTTRTFTPAKGFKGTATITYTVDDARGGTATAAITIAVEKSKGAVSIYRVHPTNPSVRSTVYVYATVMVDGKNAKKGTTVYGYAKGKKVVTGKVNSVGKVKLKLPNKLPYGKATLKVTQAGSSKLNGGSDSLAVRVRK
jgi:hypothetical protein